MDHAILLPELGVSKVTFCSYKLSPDLPNLFTFVMILTELCLGPVSRRGVLRPGAARLHAGGPGQPEWNRHQWQPDLAGQHLISVCSLFLKSP